MDPCWKNLPCDLVTKICNMLPKVRKIDENLSDEIKNQWYKFDKLYYTALSVYGFDQVWFALYDDMRILVRATDSYPDEMPLHHVVYNMWKTISPEERDEILVYY